MLRWLSAHSTYGLVKMVHAEMAQYVVLGLVKMVHAEMAQYVVLMG